MNKFLTADTAAHRAAKDYPGGITAVAAVAGHDADYLGSKLRDSCPGHHLYASDFTDILEVTRSPLMMDAICNSRGRTVWFDLGAVDGIAGDMAMLDNVTELIKQVGDLCSSVSASLEDGSVDDKEVAELTGLVQSVARAGFGILERAKQIR